MKHVTLFFFDNVTNLLFENKVISRSFYWWQITSRV